MTVIDLFAVLVADEDAAAGREHYCEVVSEQLANVASWLSVDAWLGAGDHGETSAELETEPDPARRRSFVAVGLVAQISSELVSGALLLFRNRNAYGASALLRQLIECEYLLRAFRLNFADAARWHDANGGDHRDFTPRKLREIGGFDRQEYSDHCEAGGHPHPKGRQLLELPRQLREFQLRATGDAGELDMIRVLWLDFAFHCNRTWRALAELLSAEHARFERVRAKMIAAEKEAFTAWNEADALAVHAGRLLGALKGDPSQPITELLDLDE